MMTGSKQVKHLDEWERQFELLKRFHREHGSWPHDETEYPNGNPLGAWCKQQRDAFKQHRIKTDRALKLMHIEFSFLTDEEKWQLQYEWLKEYLNDHQKSFPDDDTQYPPGNFLGVWCNEQRANYRKKKLDTEKVALLRNLAFVLN